MGLAFMFWAYYFNQSIYNFCQSDIIFQNTLYTIIHYT